MKLTFILIFADRARESLRSNRDITIEQEISKPKKALLEVDDETKSIYFISLVGSDAGDWNGKGFPRNAFYIFDVKSEMELEKHNIKFLSCQDLLEYYQKETGLNGEEMNVYELVQFFMEKNPNGYYLLDEVPLIKGIVFESLRHFIHSLMVYKSIFRIWH